MKPYFLRNQVRPYAWGSRDFIATMQGRNAPAPTPEAELWMGAHPQGSSTLEEDGGRRIALREVIATSPIAILGAKVAARFSGELPFLMKVLAAAEPLSLQVHPDRTQAEAGFAAENLAGIPLSSPARCYKDPHHKPELIVALTPFDALCGFRPVPETRQLLERLAIPELAPFQAILGGSPERGALRTIFEELMTADEARQRRLSDAILGAAARARDAGAASPLPPELELTLRLGALYPGDVGIVCALFLNRVRLRPYEALYLPAGNLHAYLGGAGVEIMASSDNVLRGGLTPKTVNAAELLRVLKFDALEPEVLHAIDAGSGEGSYVTPAEEFELSVIRLGPRPDVHADPTADASRGPHELTLGSPTGPEVWLVTQGEIEIETDHPSGSMRLSAGNAVFVPATLSSAFVLTGAGTMFRAKVPEAP